MGKAEVADVTFELLSDCDEPLSRELLELYRQADFLDGDESWEYIPRMIRGSYLFVTARRGGRLAGAARSISDGVSDAYIQDVAVMPDCRGAGIGSGMMEYLIEALQRRNIEWIGLIGVAGSSHFYQRLGFEPLSEMTPMRYWREAGQKK
ncbi:MAG: GNAT family N-acetyltransferase [Victivallaceae bacterium]